METISSQAPSSPLIYEKFGKKLRMVNIVILLIIMCFKSFGDAFESINRTFFVNDDMKHVFLAMGIFLLLLEIAFLKNKTRVRLINFRQTKLFFIGIVILIILTAFYVVTSGSLSSSTLKFFWYYSAGVIYAFLLINTLKPQEIVFSMKCVLIIFIIGFMIEKYSVYSDGISFNEISFSSSYSPFESSYFAGPAMGLFAFFAYKPFNTKLCKWVSYLFVFFTFKRVILVFATILLIVSFFDFSQKKVRKIFAYIIGIIFIILTLVISYWFLTDNVYYLDTKYNISMNEITMSRVSLYNRLLDMGFVSHGLGSSVDTIGRPNAIELEFLQIYLEVGFVGLVTFIAMYCQFATINVYCLVFMVGEMVNAWISTSFLGVFSWIIKFLALGLIAYTMTLSKDEIEKLFPKKSRKKE